MNLISCVSRTCSSGISYSRVVLVLINVNGGCFIHVFILLLISLMNINLGFSLYPCKDSRWGSKVHPEFVHRKQHKIHNLASGRQHGGKKLWGWTWYNLRWQQQWLCCEYSIMILENNGLMLMFRNWTTLSLRPSSWSTASTSRAPAPTTTSVALTARRTSSSTMSWSRMEREPSSDARQTCLCNKIKTNKHAFMLH